MSAAHRKCDASNYETKQLVICSSVKMLSTTGETAGWSIEGAASRGVKSWRRGRGKLAWTWHDFVARPDTQNIMATCK